MTSQHQLLTEKPTANSGFKKLAVQCLNEVLCFVSSSVVTDSLVLRNHQLLKPVNSCALCLGNTLKEIMTFKL